MRTEHQGLQEGSDFALEQEKRQEGKTPITVIFLLLCNGRGKAVRAARDNPTQRATQRELLADFSNALATSQTSLAGNSSLKHSQRRQC